MNTKLKYITPAKSFTEALPLGNGGAVIALDMDKLRTMEEMKNDLALIVARGICKNVGRDEIHSLVDQIYDEFGGQA